MNTLPPLKHDFLHRYNMVSLTIAHGVKAILSLQSKLDFEVYLPTKGVNLQREFVWSQEQKESFIESIIIRRPVPPISVILKSNDTYQVIDGKQRLSTLLSYLRGGFSYCGYFIDELPHSYYMQLERFHLEANRICELYGEEVTDEDKVRWFCYINFVGVPQEIEHKNKLLGKIDG